MIDDILIERYEIKAHIATMGYGAVYRAHDLQQQRDVMVKAYLPTLPDAIQQLLTAETMLMATVSHPHILPLLDSWTTDEGRYMVTPYYERTLHDLLREAPLKPEQCLAIIRQLGLALDHLHQMTIMHCHIKPTNIYIDDDENAWLADFRLAHVNGKSIRDDVGMVEGTVAYMSPEQLKDEAINGQSDIYALGIIVYEMLTGQSPFKQDNVHSSIFSKLSEDVPSLAGDLAVFEPVIQKALAIDPADRYGSAGEMVQAFEAAIPQSS